MLGRTGIRETCREDLKIEKKVPEEERTGREGKTDGGRGGWKEWSVSGSTLTNGSAELAGAPGSANSWVSAPQREQGNGVFTCRNT